MTDPQPDPQPDASPATGHAVYDTTLERFVGGVFRGKDAAKDARASVKDHHQGHGYEVRGV